MDAVNTMKNKEAIILRDVEIGYTHNRLKKPVMGVIDATLYSGELVALIGRNGAGKSTLLRTLSAFQPPLSGTITYPDGVSAVRTARELSTMLAVVLTDNSGIYNLSVHEVVALGRTPYINFMGYKRKHDKEIIEQAMQRMNILHLADRNISTLSDGERQKVMIAKALAQETSVIMLDEPTAFLDFDSRIQLFRQLKQLAKETGKTILVSTHDLEQVLQIADRLWLIHNDRLHTGTVVELAESGVLSGFIDGDGIRYNVSKNRIELI